MKRIAISTVLGLGLVVGGCAPVNKDLTTAKLDFKGQRYEKARDHLLLAIEVDPVNGEAQYYLGMTLLELKDYAGVHDAFAKTRELTPGRFDKKIESEVDRVYVELYQDARTYGEQGKSERAITLMSGAVALDPSRMDGHLALGSIHGNAGDFKSAAASLRRATEIEPDNEGAHFSLGLVYFNATEYDNAAGSFERVRELNSQNLDALENLARCYQRAERFDKMIPIYQSIIELNPDSADAHYNYGIALINAEKLDMAARELEAVVRLDENDNEALLNLSRIYRDLSRWDDALGKLNLYISRKPEDANGFTEKARVYTAWAEEAEGAGDARKGQSYRKKALDNLQIAGQKTGS